jgi:hypothetical protein
MTLESRRCLGGRRLLEVYRVEVGNDSLASSYRHRSRPGASEYRRTLLRRTDGRVGEFLVND